MELFPEKIKSEEELEEILSRPYRETIEDLKHIDGDFMVLGAGGKIGPSLVMMLARAFENIDPERKIYAVSRFSGRNVLNKLSSYKNVIVSEKDLSDKKVLRIFLRSETSYIWSGENLGLKKILALRG